MYMYVCIIRLEMERGALIVHDPVKSQEATKSPLNTLLVFQVLVILMSNPESPVGSRSRRDTRSDGYTRIDGYTRWLSTSEELQSASQATFPNHNRCSIGHPS